MHAGVAGVLDIEDARQLTEYLRDGGWISAGETPSVRVLTGGVSNRTVLVETASGVRWVLKQALPKLRVAVDWFSSPDRIRREADGIRVLSEILGENRVPALVFEDASRYLLAMRAVPEPHQNWRDMLLAGALDARHIQEFAVILALIHARSSEAAAELRPRFADRSFFESLRLEPYYAYTAGREPQAAAFLHSLIGETRAQSLALVHGDYSPKNILVRGSELHLLDHEVIHFGDPAFDIGFSMTHLLAKANHVEAMRDAFAEAAKLYWRTYSDTLGAVGWYPLVHQRAVRHAIACLLARISGRSPLNYLTSEGKLRQREAALRMMVDVPESMPLLIERFVQCLSSSD